MIIKCKMCGGDIEFNVGDTFGQCDHCGCTSTIPKGDDEQKLNRFNRANHYRRQCEFDKAIAAYEKILEEDDTDAEAHWGIVLSKYGIEYVEDPISHERIPTCHRVQPESILTDEDYLSAIEHASDTTSRGIYEQEAKRIADIQKGILAISSQEKPYDVFICYKETEDSGSRTKDSTLAQEIYYQLTNEGYKVFFSRITLEDKLGQEYEPYIFAALNSAKVMIVVGTSQEHFNAVWVKNEWSRYLALMRTDRKRILIPCYRDMDPYDLPEELSSLQSQDMSKIGFMQDIIHGVKKVLSPDKKETASINMSGPGITSLHKRAMLFLEDSDWDSAQEYFDRILDMDPEYAPAYIGKVQIKNRIRKEADLARAREPLTNDSDYQKAVRFADEQQKAIYQGYNRAITERIELERKEAIYREADALEKRAAVENEFMAAAEKYDAAGTIRDAKERAANCRAKAATARAEAERAAAAYKEQMEKERQERAKEEEQRRLAEERRAQQEKREAEKRKKRNKKILAIAAAVLLLVAAGYFINEQVIQPKIQYNNAQKLLNNNEYDQAINAFGEIGQYGDSTEKVKEAYYRKGLSLLEAGELDSAAKTLASAGDYSDAQQIIENISNYKLANKYYENADYLKARPIYSALGNFLDSQSMYETTSGLLYEQFKASLADNDYKTASVYAAELGDYSDCLEITTEIDNTYDEALRNWEEGNKQEAETKFLSILGWKDSENKLAALREEIADDAVENGDYDTALEYYGKLDTESESISLKIADTKKKASYKQGNEAFELLDLETALACYTDADDYLDAGEKAGKIKKYQAAEKLLEEDDYTAARAIYVDLGEFLDAATKLETCNKNIYLSAISLLEDGNIPDAYALFEIIPDYSDSAERMTSIEAEYDSAIALIAEGERFKAEEKLQGLSGWRDVDEQLSVLRLGIANDAFDEGDYETAIAYYGKLDTDDPEIAGRITEASQRQAYQNGITALNGGDYDLAVSCFTEAGDYSDSKDMIAKIKNYQQGCQYITDKKYSDARGVFVELGEFLDSPVKLETCNKTLYGDAKKLMNAHQYAAAYKAFSRISDYSDSAAIVSKMDEDYNSAKQLLKEKKWDEAIKAFQALYDFKDSESMVKEAKYLKADALFTEGKYSEAAALYSELGQYKKSADKTNQSKYKVAEKLLDDQDIDGAIAVFEEIPDYSDSQDRANELRYQKANTLWEAGDLQAAAEQFAILGEYKDAPAAYKKVTVEKADLSIGNKDYAAALTAYQSLEQTDDIKEREYQLAQTCYDEGFFETATLAYEGLGQYQLSLSKLPVARYAWADQLFSNGQYQEAADQFTLLGDMTDSKTRAKESLYCLAVGHMEKGNYDQAKAIFQKIPGYSDADTQAQECDYRKACNLMNDGKNKQAQQIFESLGEYSDSKTKLQQCIYNQAEALFNAEKYAEAKPLYDSINYLDSSTKAKQCVYNQAEALLAEKDYVAAKELYETIEYKDSETKAKLCAYREAERLYGLGQYAEAENVFLSLGEYSDSADQAKDCHVQQGNVLMGKGDYTGALVYYEAVDYGDSAVLAAKCHYQLGRAELVSGNVDEAVAQYAYATSLEEVQAELLSIAKDYLAINEIEKAIQTLWLIRGDETADRLLMEIGSLKVQNGDPVTAIIAYSAADKAETSNTGLFESVWADSIIATLDSWHLLPEDLHFKEFVFYNSGNIAFSEGKYSEAEILYTKAGNYLDAPELVTASIYNIGLDCCTTKNYSEAVTRFESIIDYEDAKEQIKPCYYGLAQSYEKTGYYKTAEDYYSKAEDYSDAQAKVKQMQSIIQNAPMYLVHGKSGFGYCNEKGEIVIPCQWHEAGSFVDGIATVYDTQGRIAYINTSGTIIIPFSKDKKYAVKYGFVLTASADDMYKITVYDINGNIVFSRGGINNTELAEGGLFYNTRDEFYTCRYYDFKTKQSKEICPCLGVDHYGDGYLSVSFDTDEHALIDKDGNIALTVHEPWKIYDRCSEGIVCVWNSNTDKHKYMTVGGKDITKAEWSTREDFSEGHAAVGRDKKGGPYGYIDKNGKVVVEIKYDGAKPFSNGLAAVKKNGKWGFVNTEGNVVIDIKYNDVGSFHNGYALVTLNNTKYYIDKTGAEAFPYEVD